MIKQYFSQAGQRHVKPWRPASSMVSGGAIRGDGEGQSSFLTPSNLYQASTQRNAIQLQPVGASCMFATDAMVRFCGEIDW